MAIFLRSKSGVHAYYNLVFTVMLAEQQGNTQLAIGVCKVHILGTVYVSRGAPALGVRKARTEKLHFSARHACAGTVTSVVCLNHISPTEHLFIL